MIMGIWINLYYLCSDKGNKNARYIIKYPSIDLEQTGIKLSDHTKSEFNISPNKKTKLCYYIGTEIQQNRQYKRK